MGEHSVPTSKGNPLAYLKAIGGGIATGAFILTAYIQGEETFLDVTTNEWLWVLIGTLATFGITYVLPNKRTGL
jgi:hypothetical protein